MKLHPRRIGSGSMMLALPGPDRKRLPALYSYRVLYRATDPTEVGCVMVWEVSGGRLPYQVSLERTPWGECRWYCTCADAVYRGDENPDHCCKHVQGLMDCLPQLTHDFLGANQS